MDCCRATENTKDYVQSYISKGKTGTRNNSRLIIGIKLKIDKKIPLKNHCRSTMFEVYEMVLIDFFLIPGYGIRI